jgi:hypothetical protein
VFVCNFVLLDSSDRLNGSPVFQDVFIVINSVVDFLEVLESLVVHNIALDVSIAGTNGEHEKKEQNQHHNCFDSFVGQTLGDLGLLRDLGVILVFFFYFCEDVLWSF